MSCFPHDLFIFYTFSTRLFSTFYYIHVISPFKIQIIFMQRDAFPHELKNILHTSFSHVSLYSHVISAHEMNSFSCVILSPNQWDFLMLFSSWSFKYSSHIITYAVCYIFPCILCIQVQSHSPTTICAYILFERHGWLF